MKKVVWFNHYHNGDIHASRGIVKQIINHVHRQDPTITFAYSHRNPSNLLLDIPNLEFDGEALNNVNPHDSLVVIGDTAYINTWYDQQHQKYARQCGILTIDILYVALNEACQKLWGFSLEDISVDPKDFFPSIDYSKFDISRIQSWLQEHPGKKVLVESGHAMSGQAHNFDMTSVVVKLAEKHPDITFILSNKNYTPLPNNVICTSDIIQKQTGSDLNEISFISTHCDLIIGRASGVFTFSLVKENLFERSTKMLCFSHLVSGQHKYWLGNLFVNRVGYSSIFTIESTSNVNEIQAIIARNL